MLTSGALGPAAGGLISMLMVYKSAMIASIIAKLTGMKTSSFTSLLAILSMLGPMGGAIGKITGAESAKAALPDREDMDKKLEGVASGFSAMPDAIR